MIIILHCPYLWLIDRAVVCRWVMWPGRWRRGMSEQFSCLCGLKLLLLICFINRVLQQEQRQLTNEREGERWETIFLFLFLWCVWRWDKPCGFLLVTINYSSNSVYELCEHPTHFSEQLVIICIRWRYCNSVIKIGLVRKSMTFIFL